MNQTTDPRLSSKVPWVTTDATNDTWQFSKAIAANHWWKLQLRKQNVLKNKIIWVFYLLWNKILDFYFLFWSSLVLPIEKIILQSWSSSRNISFPSIPQVVCVHHCINHRKVTFIFNTKNSGSIFWGTVAQVDDQMKLWRDEQS